MKLRVEPAAEGISRVFLTGRLDVFGTQEIDQEFHAQVVSPQKSVILDLSELEYLSSVGLRIFLSAARVLRASGAKLILLNPQAMVDKTLRLSGTDQVIPIETSLEAALRQAQH